MIIMINFHKLPYIILFGKGKFIYILFRNVKSKAMRSGLKIFILMLGICFILSLLVACGKSSSELYWHNNPNGIVHVSQDGQNYALPIDTNDLTRLQKVVPFTIMLPKYLPDGQNSYRFQMIFDQLIVEPNLSIIYDNLKNTKEIKINERQLSDYDLLLVSYPEYLDNQAKLNGGIVITIAGIKIWEREDKTYVLPRFYYSWNQSKIEFFGDIYGYDTDITRKIIESVIK
jgi:hypothetical protein